MSPPLASARKRIRCAHSWGRRNLFTRAEPALLRDTPRRNVRDNWDHPFNQIEQNYETAVMVLEGRQTGRFLGSLRWGWRYVPGNGVTLGVPAAAVRQPTAMFSAAARRWNAVAQPRDQSEFPLVPMPGNDLL